MHSLYMYLSYFSLCSDLLSIPMEWKFKKTHVLTVTSQQLDRQGYGRCSMSPCVMNELHDRV